MVVVMEEGCYVCFCGAFKTFVLDSWFVSGRLETDIHFGRKFGTRTLLVLTGITKESDLKDNLPSDMTPELYTDTIADLLQCVQ